MPKLMGLTKKVHPNAAVNSKTTTTPKSTSCSSSPSNTTTFETSPTLVKSGTTSLTVWKKSLLMSCSGFTVFDSIGNLVYRVDNYIAGSKSEIVLMNASGEPLYTIRRKQRLSLGDNWLVYDGETTVNPRMSAKKCLNFRNTKSLVQVSASGLDGGSGTPSCKNLVYEVEGSYGQRNCVIYDRNRRCAAEIKRKEAAAGGADFGNDVFRLVVQPEMDSSLAMAVVILIDQMYEPSSARR